MSASFRYQVVRPPGDAMNGPEVSPHQELVRLSGAGDLRGLATRLAPTGQALPHPDRLYRGLGMDDAELDFLLSNLAAGRGVPSREAYSAEKLADFAVTECQMYGAGRIRALFNGRTSEVEAAVRRLESALGDLKCLLRTEVASRLAAEPELEFRLFELIARCYLVGEAIPPFLQSAFRGGADGTGAGLALKFAIERGAKLGRHAVVIEFERPAAGIIVIELPGGAYQDGIIHEFVVLGDIPGELVHAVWIDREKKEFLEQYARAREGAGLIRSGAEHAHG